MNELLRCVWTGVRRDVEAIALYLAGLFAVGLAVFLILCLLSGAAAACLPEWLLMIPTLLLVFMAYVLGMALVALFLYGATCLAGLAIDAFDQFLEEQFGIGAIPTLSPLATTCEEAQAELRRARQALAAAQGVRIAQRRRTDAAQRRLDAATRAASAALAGLLAVAFWRPDLLPALIAAFVVALVLVALRSSQRARELAALAAAEAGVIQAVAVVAAAQAVVDVLCRPSVEPPPTQEPPPTGKTPGVSLT